MENILDIIKTNFDYKNIKSIILSKHFAIENEIFYNHVLIMSGYNQFKIPIIITTETSRDYYIEPKNCDKNIKFCKNCFENNQDCWTQNKRLANARNIK